MKRIVEIFVKINMFEQDEGLTLPAFRDFTYLYSRKFILNVLYFLNIQTLAKTY